jgi:transketolase
VQLLRESMRIATRGVSVPSLELFVAQPDSYRDAALPPTSRRVTIEAGVPYPPERHVGSGGLAIGMRRSGASTSTEMLAEKLGFTAPQVAAAAGIRRGGVAGEGRAATLS